MYLEVQSLEGYISSKIFFGDILLEHKICGRNRVCRICTILITYFESNARFIKSTILAMFKIPYEQIDVFFHSQQKFSFHVSVTSE